jgi:hypothetical protein
MTLPNPSYPTAHWSDWKYVPKTGKFDDSPATFGSSSAKIMRTHLFYIGFKVKKVNSLATKFGICSVSNISPDDQQEKDLSIVTLRHYAGCRFS